MITYEDIEDLLENILVRKMFVDGELQAYELFPHEGYALHMKGDDGFTTDEGIYIPPHYSYYMMTAADDDLNRFETVWITSNINIKGEPVKPTQLS